MRSNTPKKRGPARWWGPVYGLVLTGYTAYVLLDAFVIPRSYVSAASASAPAASSAAAGQETGGASAAAADQSAASAAETGAAATATVTATSYTSDAADITLTTYREYDTTIYVADITLTDPGLLATAFADDTYGKNITAKTSAIAAANNAILAVNGDYYSARSGYVIRNGVLYRSTSADAGQEDLVIDAAGNFSIVTEGDTTAEALLAQGAQQVLSFGPALVENGEVSVTADEEVGKAMASNPRTAIAQVGEGHYLMVVADGRTGESSGLSLYEFATFLQGLGAVTAYNLDGGGSSTMVFNGAVVNKPTTNGNKISERSVSDIVYIG